MAAFRQACGIVEGALAGSARRNLVGENSLRRLRKTLRSHALAPFVPEVDRQTRRDGFHVLHDWDGRADHVNPEIIPVDVLDYVVQRFGDEESYRTSTTAILLDYYFLHVLSLLSLRIWDEGDPDANLDRLDGLLGLLQGPGSSGQRFAAGAATLLLMATAHYELEERGYHQLLEKVLTLNAAHRLAIARDHAASLGCHLRFGFEATYGRDIALMRSDNGTDYPWLAFALMTLVEEYARSRDLSVAEAILNGLSPDALAFVRVPGFRDAFSAVQGPLLETFETLRPGDEAYSPLSFFFNFSHNVVKGAVVDALLTGETWAVTLNDLLTGMPPEPPTGPKQSLATRLMGYARLQPDQIRGRPMPAMVYDPLAGRRAFSLTLRKAKEIGAAAGDSV
jgi:hypothetical protein